MPTPASALALLLALAAPAVAGLAPQDAPSSPPEDAPSSPPTEADYYELVDVAPQFGVVGAMGDLSLEVGGLAFVDADTLLACTRRGEVWRVEGYATATPRYALFADGLHEPLGLLLREADRAEGWVTYVQRSELARMRDADGDGRADEFETICDGWQISGNYHEYAFGPREDADGNLWVTLNRPFGSEPFGKADFRGWAARIAPDGSTIEFVASGLRSPAGIERSPWGELFYTDNQGEWHGTNSLSLLEPGQFHGHPWGIASSDLEPARVPYPSADPDLRDFEPRWRKGALYPDAAEVIPNLTLPAIWFPYDTMGRSASGFDWDETGGAFGPFGGQVFVGDQYEASVMRVSLEQVDGVWQGACYPFRHDLASGVIRAQFDPFHPAGHPAGGEDTGGGLYVGMSDRGWTSVGARRDGIQRIVWTGAVPFEVRELTALPDGFRLELTRPCDPASVSVEAFRLSSYTYELHEPYGSLEMDGADLEVASATVSADGLVIDLVVGAGTPHAGQPARGDGQSARSEPLAAPALRLGYVHEVRADGLRDAATGWSLLHPDAYYTLNRRPR